MSCGNTATPVGTLVAVAAACRDSHRLRFDYRAHDGATGVRDVEPYRLVNTGRRWYLVAGGTGGPSACTADFTVDGPPELLDALRDIHRRTGQSTPRATPPTP